MTLPVLILIFLSIIFALVAVVFSFREERLKGDLKKQKEEMDRKVYELLVINNISEKIGYSLNIESIAQTIALSVEQLFSLSTVSYALIKEGKIKIENLAKDAVGEDYLDEISNIIISSLIAIDGSIKELPIEKSNSSINRDINTSFDAVRSHSSSQESSDYPKESSAYPQERPQSYPQERPQSYFNIPLVVNNSLVGMINISSKKKNIYQEEDMSIIYKIVNTSQIALGKLDAVIETEKGKLESLIYSLSSGAILFVFEKNKFSLSVINPVAKIFLNLTGEVSVVSVLSKFPAQYEIQKQIKNSLIERKTVLIRKVILNERYFDIFLNPVFFYNTGKIIGVSMVMRDMTLEKKINDMREEFTNIMIHELRSPLIAIKGASDLLTSSDLKPEDNERMMSVISNSTKRMMENIQDFLDASKADSGKLEIKKSLSSIDELVREHIEVFSFAARDKNIKINLEIKNEIPKFFFDSGRIGQVIDNLLSNSLKYTPSGGKIDLRISQKNNFLTIETADTGVGIPDDKKPLLFTKFGQIGHSKNANSSGLGLYISKQIIDAHGGKIWIESKEGQGTRVFFTLPIIVENREDKVGIVPKVLN